MGIGRSPRLTCLVVDGYARSALKGFASILMLDRSELQIKVTGLDFAPLSALELAPIEYCFRDENRWRIDDVVAEMIGSDPSDPDVGSLSVDIY